MFDLIIMLSRYLFVIYIGLYLWEAIVYIAYEQGGYLGSPYRAVSVPVSYTHLRVREKVTGGGFLYLWQESGKRYKENVSFLKKI